MESPIRWGVIGLGRIAHKFVQDLAYIHDAQLSAVASTSADRSEAFAKQYGAKYHYGSYEGILSCPELDVVYIATPHTSHCKLTVMCLEARIPVLCEKPFGMDLREVRQMVWASHANQTFLMEAMWSRFIPGVQKAKEMVERGEIGKLHTIKADFGFNAPLDMEGRLYNKSLGGGSLLDVGIYPVFLALLLLGKPKRIHASAKLGVTGVDESCAMLFEYEGGEIGMLHSSIVAKTGVEAYLYGDKGSIYMHSGFYKTQTLTKQLNSGESEEISVPYQGHGYHFEAREVQACLRAGVLQSSLMPHWFSLDLIGQLDRVRKKIRLGY